MERKKRGRGWGGGGQGRWRWVGKVVKVEGWGMWWGERVKDGMKTKVVTGGGRKLEKGGGDEEWDAGKQKRRGQVGGRRGC